MNPFRKLRLLFGRSKLEREMQDEMRAHLDEQTARNLAAGMSPDHARAAAHREFGGVAQIQERARDARCWRWLDDLLRDVRIGLRQLRKAPGFTTIAVLTLALGIGVNTSMFTALQSLLLREFPYPDSDRLVLAFRTSNHGPRGPHSPANFLDLQADNTVFTAVAAMQSKSLSLVTPGQPAEQVRGMLASSEIFPVLGLSPQLGRGYAADEDRPGQDDVAVLSHAFWMQRFAGDPEVVGRTLRLDGRSTTIIGVLPERFSDPLLFGSVDIWRPIAFSAAERGNRGGNYLKIIARLRPGVSLAQAQAGINVFAERQAGEHPDENSGAGLRLVPLAKSIDPRGRMLVWLAMGLAGFVLLIACANLANLQLARTARRAHELAIRGALGAGRSRIIRQLLTESMVVAIAGGAGGLLLASWGNEWLSRLLTNDSGRMLDLSLNPHVFSFAVVTLALAGAVFGLLPAWLMVRADPQRALSQGARGMTGGRAQHRLRHGLIIAEMALALVLLSGAGLVLRGLREFMHHDPGWHVDDLTLARLSLPESSYGDEQRQGAFVNRLEEKLAALPGVDRVAVAWALPVSPFNVAGSFNLRDRPAPPPGREPLRFLDGVTPEYFATLNVRLLAGRTFTADDRARSGAVVIINDTMARALWPNESALGKVIDDEEVVGVVSDVNFPADPSEPMTAFQTYRPFAQSPRPFLTVALRGHPSAEAVRRTVAELDPDLPVREIESAQAAVDRALGRISGVGRLFSAFSGLGLLLAALGIYGVVAGFVAERTREIGVRMALGAQVRAVLWLIVRRGLGLTLLGAIPGSLGALAIERVFSSVTPGLAVRDPLTIPGVSILLLGVALLACWLPARRAARIDPIRALRSE